VASEHDIDNLRFVLPQVRYSGGRGFIQADLRVEAHAEDAMNSISCAILMKVHYWDDFAQRRLQHLLAKAGAAHVYIFVDETHGAVGGIEHERVVRATENDMSRLEIALYPLGNLFWYNVEYPLYHFYRLKPDYDYYLMCEHDAVMNTDIDGLVRVAASEGVDYVGFPVRNRSSWTLPTAEGVYPGSFQLHQWLSCVSLYSKRSIEFLLKRRQILTAAYQDGQIAHWPNNEVFIPTEMINNGFVVRELGAFGKTEKYNWWPPTHEHDLAQFEDQTFLHPVLDERRYVGSCLRFSNLLDLRSYFRGSQLRQLLGRRPPLALASPFAKEFVRQAARRFTPTFVLDMMPRTRNAARFRRLTRQSAKKAA
jgi:hypothetical protein